MSKIKKNTHTHTQKKKKKKRLLLLKRPNKSLHTSISIYIYAKYRHSAGYLIFFHERNFFLNNRADASSFKKNSLYIVYPEEPTPCFRAWYTKIVFPS
jgi:hypothetical protein